MHIGVRAILVTAILLEKVKKKRKIEGVIVEIAHEYQTIHNDEQIDDENGQFLFLKTRR